MKTIYFCKSQHKVEITYLKSLRSYRSDQIRLNFSFLSVMSPLTHPSIAGLFLFYFIIKHYTYFHSRWLVP